MGPKWDTCYTNGRNGAKVAQTGHKWCKVTGGKGPFETPHGEILTRREVFGLNRKLPPEFVPFRVTRFGTHLVHKKGKRLLEFSNFVNKRLFCTNVVKWYKVTRLLISDQVRTKWPNV